MGCHLCQIFCETFTNFIVDIYCFAQYSISLIHTVPFPHITSNDREFQQSPQLRQYTVDISVYLSTVNAQL